MLASVESLLGWDERTMMPPQAATYRAEQAAALALLVHQHRTDPVQAERLAQLTESSLATAGPPHTQATIRLLSRDHAKQARLPPRLVEALAKTCVGAQQAWAAARAASSWPDMQPWLEKIFALKREQGQCQLPDRDPYDALMDDYEPGAHWPAVAARFDSLRGQIVSLLQACMGSSRRPDPSLLARRFPIDAQQRFVRNALFGVLHEAGHGLYEQGLSREWYGLPPGEAASLGVHESQSRLWENMVGRSPEFWEWCFPLAQQAFPTALADADAVAMQQSLMAVQPSLIRVEADEVTYNLHVMLRFDLERAMVLGELRVADLPDAWNQRYETDLGHRPPSAADGVLQDIHWSAGLVGYFPTYALGNMFAAQLMAAAERTIPRLDRKIAKGSFGELLEWLRHSVHSRGRLLESEPLVEEATDTPVSEHWLVESLRRRYGPGYGLKGLG